MAQEPIDIRVRVKGGARAKSQIAGIGSAAQKAALGASKLGAALAAIGAAVGVAKVAKDAVAAAGAMEGFGVRLKALLGSQGAANAALEDFVKLSTETPFAVNQIVKGATTLATVTGKNKEQLKSLTGVAANLAAVTGLTFEQSAENIQRSLSAGLASADLFRTAGVRTMIESLLKIPDATKLGPGELLKAFEALAGEGGKFGTSAKDLSLTLNGALSNIGDAAFSFEASLGSALSPVVIGVAKGVFIPFFTKLAKVVDKNKDAITDFTLKGIKGFIKGFASTLRTGADVLFFFEEIGVNAENIGRLFRVLSAGFEVFISSVKTGFQAIRTGALATVAGLKLLGNAVGLVSDAEALRAVDSFNRAQGDLEDSSFKTEAALVKLGDVTAEVVGELLVGGETAHSMSAGVEALAEKAEAAAGAVDKIAKASKKFQDANAAAKEAPDAPSGGGVGSAIDPKVLKAQESGLEKLIDLQRTLREERLASVNPLLKDLSALEDLIKSVQDLSLAEGERGRQRQVLNDLRVKRKDLLKKIKESEEGEEGGGLDFSQGVADSITAGIGAAIKGEGQSASERFGSLLQASVDSALESSLSTLNTALQESLSTLGSSISSSLGGNTALGGAISAGIGAAVSIGLAAATGGLGGSKSSSSRAGVAASAVTSTQKVRGLVAGPTTVGIGQVSLEIEEAFTETNRLAEAQLGVLGDIRDALRGGGGAAARSAEQILNTESGGLG